MEKEDLQYSEMKRNAKILVLLVITAVLISLGIKHCNAPKEVVTIKTPEVKGVFIPSKPISEPIAKTRQNLSKNDKSKNGKSFNDSFAKSQDSLINELLKENEQLSRAFYLQNDSIKKGMYEKSIQLNNFSKTFEDKFLKIDVSGISRGTVESVAANYIIKPQEQQIQLKQKVFALKLGGEVGNTLQFNDLVFKGNIEFENKKGTSFTYGYDSQSRHWLGAKITIFEIKR